MNRIVTTTFLTAILIAIGAAPALAQATDPGSPQLHQAQQAQLVPHIGPDDIGTTPDDEEPPFPPDTDDDEPTLDEPVVPEPEVDEHPSSTGGAGSSGPASVAVEAEDSTPEIAVPVDDNAQTADIVEADESGEEGTIADSILLIAVGCLAGLLVVFAASLVRERRARRA